jgi:outer membrane protein insertion porin family
MTSSLKVALISSITIVFAASSWAGGHEIRSVSFSGEGDVPRRALAGGSMLQKGLALSDSLIDLELLRIDSLCFAYGKLAAAVAIDTLENPLGVDVLISVEEGEQTRIGSVGITGSASLPADRAIEILGVNEGDLFYPGELENGLRELLAHYNVSGYPYAQIWLTGFEYDHNLNSVDLAVSVFEGEDATVSRVAFEGLAKTDSSFALRVSRLKTGSKYDESSVKLGRKYLQAAGVFQRVEEPVVKQLERGNVEVLFPVEELPRGNTFQGAFGVAQREGDDYVLSGAVDLVLKHMGGRGRDAHFGWVNNGEDYSKLELSYREPFLFSSLLSLDAEVMQIVQDSVYVYHSGGAFIGYPLGPRFRINAGAAIDRNVPDSGELTRSIRQRYRLGIVMGGESRNGLAFHVEGAYKKNYLEEKGTETEGQLLYRIESRLHIPFVYGTGLLWRAASEAVFSSREIHAAEMYPIGGARTLRGYRESQFRGERIAYTNIECWFGEEGALFLFDDVGAFYRSGDGWTVKNGLGFGLRSSSPVGIVSLSFGVGDQISLRGTRVHISLTERF